MIPGTRSPTGQLAVVQAVPPSTAPRLGGFALSDLGQVYITEVQPAVFVPAVGYHFTNGFLFDPDERLCCTITDPPAYWNGGLPFSDIGELVLTQLAPDANTSYIGGLAVRPEGVCATGAAPLIVGGFSDGYSEGF